MPAAQLPQCEDERLRALAGLNILEPGSDLGFEIFPLLASKVFDTPGAAITFIDHDTQWYKAGVGLSGRSDPRTHSICEYALLHPLEILYIPDTTIDPRVSDNPCVVRDGGIRSYAGAAISGPTGMPLGALCVYDHVPRTFSSERLEQLKYMAIGVEGAIRLHAAGEEHRLRSMTDGLTGVGNRSSFDHRLQQKIAACQRDPKRSIALLSIDLDQFKSVSDLFGHAGGDLALQEAAKRLSAALSTRDSVFRVGGDEFSVIVDISDNIGAEIVAHRIQSAFAKRFCIDQRLVPLRASIGVAVYPNDAACANTLAARADTSLYAAKRSGGGATIFARSEAVAGSRGFGRQEMQRELYSTLIPSGNEPFRLAMQPIVHADSGALTGFEALIRWPREDGNMMLPGDFIPTAEATGLIVQLDRWVIDRACRRAVTFPSHLTISCNVSAANFLSGHLVADVCKALSRYGVEPNRLKLEVTETILLRDAKRVRSIMLELRGLGIDVILDDFGTGNASIAYLRDYPFNGIKIDKSFVSQLEIDSRRRVFIRAILDMARSLNLTVTAEGVETVGQRRLLHQKKVDLIQGYLMGRPMLEDVVGDYLYERNTSDLSGPNLSALPPGSCPVNA